MPAHIRKGDVVFVRSGSDKGKTGEVVSVDPSTSRCVVKGINLRTKHMKPTQLRPKGAIVKLEPPHPPSLGSTRCIWSRLLRRS